MKKLWLIGIVALLPMRVWAQASPDNSRVPPLTSVVDSAGGTWTFDAADQGGGSHLILRNGMTGNGGVGNLLLVWKGAIYAIGSDSKWYAWTNGWGEIAGDPTTNATPTLIISGVQVIVTAPGSNPALAAPVVNGTRTTPISVSSTNCNLPMQPSIPIPVLNPTSVMFDDPWHVGKGCKVLMPTGIANGTGYRVAAQFTTPTGTPACGVTPCTSTRTVVPDPFALAAPVVRPAAPMGVAFRP